MKCDETGPSLWEGEVEWKREMHLVGHSYSNSVIPLLSLLLFFIRSTKIQSAPKRCGNPTTLPNHIPIFPQTWSLSEYLLWSIITALIKAKHFVQRLLDLLFFFVFFSHGMVSASHLNIKSKLIWQCAATTQRTPFKLLMQMLRNHMLVYWTEVLAPECLNTKEKLLPIFWHRFVYELLKCVEMFSCACRKQQKHKERENVTKFFHCGRLTNNHVLCESLSCIFSNQLQIPVSILAAHLY